MKFVDDDDVDDECKAVLTGFKFGEKKMICTVKTYCQL